jgi:hypothetical protein
MRKATYETCLLICGLVAVSTCAGQEWRGWERPPCPALKNSSSKELLTFLESGNPSTDTNTACVADAILRLGYDQSEAAVDVLIRYLGFADPFYEVRKNSRISESLLLPWSKYPAIGALSSIGKAAQAKIIRAVGSAEVSDLARRNAVTSIMLNFRENPKAAVELLNDANRSSHDAVASVRLLGAAREAITWCPKETRYICEAVILDQSGK